MTVYYLGYMLPERFVEAHATRKIVFQYPFRYARSIIDQTYFYIYYSFHHATDLLQIKQTYLSSKQI